MKKYYLKVVFVIILLMIPFGVKADCTYNDRVRLQKLASNVSFSYHYTDTQYSVVFQITVSNLTSEIYMVDKLTNQTYYADNQDFTIPGYAAGQTLRFDFYAKNTDCMEGTLFTNYVTLPSYNPYHTNKLCKGVEEFELCQKWLKHNMGYKEFYEGVLAYKNRQLPVTEEKQESKKEFDWNVVVEFWAQYYIYILLTIIIGGGTILYRYDKKTDL